jgi:serine/threonine-protein kinase RsbW
MTDEPLLRCTFSPDRLVHRLTAVIPGKVEEIESVTRRIISVVNEMGCAEGKEFEIETALREALANAVTHGCSKCPGGEVEIDVECDPEKGMLIVIRDPGEGFDPRTVPSPLVGENLYSDSGRGIFLINRLMDEVTFEKGGTEIRMLKR